MKRVFVVLAIVALIAILGMGFKEKRETGTTVIPKKFCGGYEVIEANKGVDCNGDTIQLIRRNGFYEIASTR